MNVAVPEQYYRLLEQGFQCLDDGDAEEALRRALEAHEMVPGRSEALYLLGLCSWKLDRHVNALELFLEGHRIAPDTLEFSGALAHLYAQLGKLVDSLFHTKLTHTQKSDPFLARFVPANLQSLNNVMAGAGFAAYMHHATLAFQAQDYAKAQEHCESQLAIHPEDVECLHLYGRVLTARGQPLKAISALRGAIAAGRDDPASFAMLAKALCDGGEFAAAIDVANDAVRRGEDDLDVLARAIHALDALPAGMDVARGALVARWRQQMKAEPLSLDTERAPFPGRPFRIGYLINDIAAETALEELDAVVTCHDRDRVEVFVYQLFMHNPTAINRLRGKCPNWRELLDVDDATAAYILAGDELDVLVDVCPMTPGARPGILAARPAPLQVAWHGEYADDITDFVIADDGIVAALPQDSRAIALSNGPLVNPMTPFVLAVAQAAVAPCLTNGAVTFGATFDIARVIPSVSTWARILHELPGTTIMLGNVPVAEREACSRLYELFATYGVADRITLVTEDDNLPFWSKIDVFLSGLGNPVPADLVKSLMAGVPVVVRNGPQLAQARAASVLNAIGQGNWLADDDDHYAKIAMSMGRSVETAASLRRELLQVVSETPLCSGRAFTSELEAALIQQYLIKGDG